MDSRVVVGVRRRVADKVDVVQVDRGGRGRAELDSVRKSGRARLEGHTIQLVIRVHIIFPQQRRRVGSASIARDERAGEGRSIGIYLPAVRDDASVKGDCRGQREARKVVDHARG